MISLLIALLIGGQTPAADAFRESEWTPVGQTASRDQVFVRLGTQTADGHKAWLRFEIAEPQPRDGFNLREVNDDIEVFRVASIIGEVSVRCPDSHVRFEGVITSFNEPRAGGRSRGHFQRQREWQATDSATVMGRAVSMVCSGQAGPTFERSPGRTIPPPPHVIPGPPAAPRS